MHAHPVWPTYLLHVRLWVELDDLEAQGAQLLERIGRMEDDALCSDVDLAICARIEVFAERQCDGLSQNGSLGLPRRNGSCEASARLFTVTCPFGVARIVLCSQAPHLVREVSECPQLGHDLVGDGAEQLLTRLHRREARRPVSGYGIDQLLDPVQHLRSPLG